MTRLPGTPVREAVIVDAVRTPFARRRGALRNIRPDSLLAHAVRSIVQRTGCDVTLLDDLIAGCVSQAGEQAANIARIAAMLADLPETVPGTTLNRMCGSGQQAVHFAAQAIEAGDMNYVLAGGVESMTRVPMFLDLTLGQSDFAGFEGLNAALLEKYPLVHQVESAERIAEKWKLTREMCDDFAKSSHLRAQQSLTKGWHSEIIATPGTDENGTEIVLVRDEIRETIDEQKMTSMPPVFRAPGQGVVTAANASRISDGAAMLLIADRDTAVADGFRPRARFLARVACGSDPVMQLTGVIPATRMALKRAALSISDVDWIEVNEAFATVILAWAHEFSPDMDKVNPWGGAIAHGHPLGGTGGGLMAKMLAGLEHNDASLGLQVMCIGHGMATASVVERL